jgi:hypothetical protein
MNIKRLLRKNFRLWLLSVTWLAASSCVTEIEAPYCNVDGLIENGGGCAHMIAGDTCSLTTDEIIDMIDAQPTDRLCVPACGMPICAEDPSDPKNYPNALVTVKARGAAIIMFPSDWGEKKTELDTACRELGSKCSLGPAGPFPSPSPSPSPAV